MAASSLLGGVEVDGGDRERDLDGVRVVAASVGRAGLGVGGEEHLEHRRRLVGEGALGVDEPRVAQGGRGGPGQLRLEQRAEGAEDLPQLVVAHPAGRSTTSPHTRLNASSATSPRSRSCCTVGHPAADLLERCGDHLDEAAGGFDERLAHSHWLIRSWSSDGRRLRVAPHRPDGGAASGERHLTDHLEPVPLVVRDVRLLRALQVGADALGVARARARAPSGRTRCPRPAGPVGCRGRRGSSARGAGRGPSPSGRARGGRARRGARSLRSSSARAAPSRWWRSSSGPAGPSRPRRRARRACTRGGASGAGGPRGRRRAAGTCSAAAARRRRASVITGSSSKASVSASAMPSTSSAVASRTSAVVAHGPEPATWEPCR